MSRRCEISGKSRQVGNRVSHAKNRRKHVFSANIQTKKIFIPEKNAFVSMKLSTRMIRTIDKLGLNAALKKFGKTLCDLC